MLASRLPVFLGCTHKRRELVRVVARNGATHYCEFCPDCDSKSSWVPHRELMAGVNLDTVRVLENHAACSRALCELCEAPAIELHHWAPESLAGLFVDHTSWLKNFLCTAHHEEWHRIVTPYLVDGAPNLTLGDLEVTHRTTIQHLMDLLRQRKTTR